MAVQVVVKLILEALLTNYQILILIAKASKQMINPPLLLNLQLF